MNDRITLEITWAVVGTQRSNVGHAQMGNFFASRANFPRKIGRRAVKAGALKIVPYNTG